MASLAAAGGNAIGISGADGGMLQAQIKEPELGLVGKIVKVNPEPIKAVLAAGCIPVIAPVAVDISNVLSPSDSFLNVNADTVAGEIAVAFGAKRLVLLTDVEGVYDKDKKLISEIKPADAEKLIHDGTIREGMIPKIRTCINAVENGVRGVVTIDGRKPHSILFELFSDKGAGTLIRK